MDGWEDGWMDGGGAYLLFHVFDRLIILSTARWLILVTTCC